MSNERRDWQQDEIHDLRAENEQLRECLTEVYRHTLTHSVTGQSVTVCGACGEGKYHDDECAVASILKLPTLEGEK